MRISHDSPPYFVGTLAEDVRCSKSSDHLSHCSLSICFCQTDTCKHTIFSVRLRQLQKNVKFLATGIITDISLYTCSCTFEFKPTIRCPRRRIAAQASAPNWASVAFKTLFYPKWRFWKLQACIVWVCF
jgi:hypothetical protein